ncbi:MAG TPA: CheR family methyltransferase [Chitinophagaceae bacterium]|nr:CheR family methyltransferase [Chitinophagaceae bacterium]
MPKSDTDKPKILSKNLFPVVGVGASAGGLEAFKKLVKAIPEKSGMAYILVQHLHPDHSSSLPEILQRETNIPVNEISDNVKVEPDNVYIIPSNKMLVATDGVLQLSPRPPKDHKNMPIDMFFSSLAEVHQSHAIGIVLSGTGADGTIGLQNIKGQGGITFAQDIESAAYDAMPQSAINAEVVDFILPPEKMPQQLLELNRTFNILPSNDHATPEQLTEEESFKKILALLRVRKGVDFTYYKQTTIRRRILRRMVIIKLEKFVDYLEHLKQNKPEQDMLFQDMLIPVTTFFREPKTFEYLCETVFPEIIKNKSSVNPLRIWIAGCSTGEEAYSMGMCLHEYLSDKISSIKIQIFATDISEKSIAKARAGLYHKRELEDVSDSRLQQFFTKTDGNYQVKKTIRDMCVFACHNFLKDPPFAKIDLISCRNVLIYLEPFLQKKAFLTFHYALKDKGYLLLGRSETTGSSSELFLPLGKKEKLYTRKSLPGRFMNVASERREEAIKDKDYGLRSNERKKDDFQKNADDILLTKYTPAGVIVNDQLDIVQFRGSTREFLEPATGKASLSVLKMAREGLSFELRNALHKSKATNDVVRKEGIPIDNGKRLITIEVIPLLNTIDLHFLILFNDTVANAIEDAAINKKQPGSRRVNDEKDKHIGQLAKDLLQAREDMRSITEDQEAVNEELQNANEELLSGSEELQSLNEELETSKEELQSTNEELITVNQELFDRNEQLNMARFYAEAIVTTIHEPLLVLTEHFKIKSANKSFYKKFQLTEEETIGKILFDLQNKGWNIPGLHSQLLKIQKENEKFLEWEVAFTFPLAGELNICFNAQPFQQENSEHWILLAFDDITKRKEKEKIEKKNAEDLKKILENMPLIASTSLADGSPTYFNGFFLNYSGITLAEALKQGWEPLIKPEMLDEYKKSCGYAIATGEDFNMEIQLKRKSDNMYRWHLSRSSAMRNEEGIITSWVGAATDIHDQKTKEEAKDEFIGIASHELKTPLTTAKAYIHLLEMSMEKEKNKDLMYAQKAGASIDRLNSLIEELLDVSKIQSGKLPMHISTFNFNEMISAGIEEVQYTSPNHSIIKSGQTNKPVSGDMERLKQVVINLLTNAVKYSPKADKVLLNVAQENGEVKVSVRDSGIGIRKENIGKIFERYYREEKRAVHFQGLGIGLSICIEIIQRHKGKIWAESKPGKGSTFYFTIPI